MHVRIRLCATGNYACGYIPATIVGTVSPFPAAAGRNGAARRGAHRPARSTSKSPSSLSTPESLLDDDSLSLDDDSLSLESLLESVSDSRALGSQSGPSSIASAAKAGDGSVGAP